MYGPVILLCYVAMLLLIWLQQYSNKKLAALSYQNCKKTDQRINYLSQVVKAIRGIKCLALEKAFEQKIFKARTQELEIFTSYVNIKNVLTAVYTNAGVLISALIFLFADKESLELGKAFSTLALLGYIFNFSILFSNYALEAVYSLKVFMTRVHDAVDMTVEKSKLYMSMSAVDATIIDDDWDPMASFRSKKAASSKLADSILSDPSRRGSLKVEHLFSQWNVKEDQDTGEDME
mmetsp:Transcript_47238/g.34532  ORF Transcript_47238/g.34532 Transcript_47238/m.34532 type:complete len:235 (+) Transcript_47238:127-831(+)